MLLNPTTFLCPFKFKDNEQLIECTHKRHSLGSSNQLSKMVDDKQGHLTVHHRDDAAHSVAARLKLICDRPRITVDDLNSKAPLEFKEVVYRDELFAELPDLFDPGFTRDPADFQKRYAWTNRATRVAATKAEAEGNRPAAPTTID